ncbi:MAG: hypothetical protein A2542_01710 [Parcubacteria group bacterium RIFOXYD2_FULL_52_8]|nr:MAG: hypothetical protein A2542_01710 [Parcubacteria group bacterium RIFOXYD2_FULL_52_8]
MKIILAVADYKGKNVVFVSNEFQVLSLEEAARLVKSGVLEDVSLVRRGSSVYLRTKKKVPRERELNALSLTSSELTAFAQGLSHAKSTPALSRYLELYRTSLAGEHEFIKPIRNLFKVPVVLVREALVAHQAYISSAATHFKIDPFLLGAILIDEISATLPLEAIFENITAKGFGFNTSVGVAQVKIDTANDLIRKGLHNPNPKDTKLPFGRMNPSARLYLAPYVVQPKHNIFFAAGFMRFVTDFWRAKADLSIRPEIIATLYHQGYGKPHANPRPNERGEQIATEFYRLAEIWL